MAWTQTQLDALEAAIAEGVTTVHYGDKTVQYRSIDDMFKIRAAIKKSLGQVADNPRVFASFKKGLDD